MNCYISKRRHFREGNDIEKMFMWDYRLGLIRTSATFTRVEPGMCKGLYNQVYFTTLLSCRCFYSRFAERRPEAQRDVKERPLVTVTPLWLELQSSPIPAMLKTRKASRGFVTEKALQVPCGELGRGKIRSWIKEKKWSVIRNLCKSPNHIMQSKL